LIGCCGIGIPNLSTNGCCEVGLSPREDRRPCLLRLVVVCELVWGIGIPNLSTLTSLCDVATSVEIFGLSPKEGRFPRLFRLPWSLVFGMGIPNLSTLTSPPPGDASEDKSSCGIDSCRTGMRGMEDRLACLCLPWVCCFSC